VGRALDGQLAVGCQRRPSELRLPALQGQCGVWAGHRLASWLLRPQPWDAGRRLQG
jgi:hypothetical protein